MSARENKKKKVCVNNCLGGVESCAHNIHVFNGPVETNFVAHYDVVLLADKKIRTVFKRRRISDTAILCHPHRGFI